MVCNRRLHASELFRTAFLRKRIILLLVLAASFVQESAGQIGVKTNLLYDATLTPNLGVEFPLGKKSTMQLSYALHPWRQGDKMLRHWSVMPEYRYWTCLPQLGHFFGVHALGGQYRAGGYELPFNVLPNFKNIRYVGWFAGAGLSYGYAYPLSVHWNIEGEIGVGVVHTRYTQYECEQCGAEIGRNRKTFVAPTKLALNLVYVF